MIKFFQDPGSRTCFPVQEELFNWTPPDGCLRLLYYTLNAQGSSYDYDLIEMVEVHSVLIDTMIFGQ